MTADDIEIRAAAIEARLEALLSKGGTLTEHASAMRDGMAMIAELRINFAATNLLARKNIADIGEEDLIRKILPLVDHKLKARA